MNTQEIFDTVLTHARSMQHRSITLTGQCVYLSPKGSKCFIGILIPDEIYTVHMESHGIEHLLHSFHTLVPHLLPSNTSMRAGLIFLEHLQSIHDGIEIGLWEEQFKKLAEQHCLNY